MLEGLVLKFQVPILYYLIHKQLQSLEKDPVLGKVKAGGRVVRQDRWLNGICDSMDMNGQTPGDEIEDMVMQSHGVLKESDLTLTEQLPHTILLCTLYCLVFSCLLESPIQLPRYKTNKYISPSMTPQNCWENIVKYKILLLLNRLIDLI